MVSIKIKSIHPSISAAICYIYVLFNSSKVTLLNEGSSTSGDNDAILLVGSIDPATYFFFPSFNVNSSQSSFAIFAF